MTNQLKRLRNFVQPKPLREYFKLTISGRCRVPFEDVELVYEDGHTHCVGTHCGDNSIWVDVPISDSRILAVSYTIYGVTINSKFPPKNKIVMNNPHSTLTIKLSDEDMQDPWNIVLRQKALETTDGQ